MDRAIVGIIKIPTYVMFICASLLVNQTGGQVLHHGPLNYPSSTVYELPTDVGTNSEPRVLFSLSTPSAHDSEETEKRNRGKIPVIASQSQGVWQGSLYDARLLLALGGLTARTSYKTE